MLKLQNQIVQSYKMNTMSLTQMHTVVLYKEAFKIRDRCAYRNKLVHLF